MVANPVTASPEPNESISLAALAGVLARSAYWIVACATIALIIAVGVALFAPREYTTHVSFVPEGHRGSSSAGGLAAQLGIASGADASQSPAFYVDLLGTREILRRVALFDYTTRSKRGTLPVILGSGAPGSAEAVDDAIGFLRGALIPGLSPQTGVVTVKVTTEDPSLSAQIGAHVLEAVDEFNRENARNQAAQQREFTQQRLNEFRDALRGAEENLQAFLQRNRDAAVSSEAAFQRERLAREVTLRQQLYITVTQAFEQARMEESRDAPQIRTIERADPPLHPDPRGFAQKGVLGALLGALFAVVAIIVREIVEQARQKQASWYADWETARKRPRGSRRARRSEPAVVPTRPADFGDRA